MARSLARSSDACRRCGCSVHRGSPTSIRRTCPEDAPGQRESFRLQVVRVASRGAPFRRCEVDRAQRSPPDPESGIADATGTHGRRLSWARRSPSGDGRSVRQATRPRMAGFSGFHYRAWDRVERDGPGPAPSPGGLPPLPLLAIELRGRRCIEKSIVAAGPHSLCRRRPTGATMASSLDHQPAGLRMQFDFFGQIRFIEQHLRDPNSSRIADPHDTRLRGHCDYSVSTSCRVWQEPKNSRCRDRWRG